MLNCLYCTLGSSQKYRNVVGLIRVLLYLAVSFASFYLANVVHELTHFILFRAFRIKVAELNLGFFSVDYRGDKPRCSFHPTKILSASCACKADEKISCYKYVISLLGGSVSCLAMAAVLFLFGLNADITLVSVCFFIGAAFSFLNFFVNALLPFSEDRRLIKYVIEFYRERKK